MTFHISCASEEIDKYAHLGKRVREESQYSYSSEWIDVEISTLEELMDFIKKTDEPLIIYPRKHKGKRLATIYDDYIE